MKTLKLFIATGALILAGNINAQKWTQGKDMKFLKGEKEILLKFTYNGLVVGKDSEKDYVAKKVEDYNKKEAGKGDSWAKSWIADRSNVYEPKFEELFNKKSDGLSGDRTKSGAKYTLNINCYNMDPGWNIGISRKPSLCDYELTIFETATPSKIVAKGKAENIPGGGFGGYDFDVSSRIKESYAKLGKELGDQIGSKAK